MECACSTSNAVYTVIKRPARKSVTHVVIGTKQAVVGTKPPSPVITQSTALLSKWNRGLECHRRDPVHGRHRKTLSGPRARHQQPGSGRAGKDGGVEMCPSSVTEVSGTLTLLERGREVSIHNTVVNFFLPLTQHGLVTVVSCTLV